MTDETKISDRFRLLVESIGTEMGYPKGWKANLAGRMGVSPSFFSKVLAGKREISWATAENVAYRLGIDSGWFTSSGKNYRTYMRSRDRFALPDTDDGRKLIELISQAKGNYAAVLSNREFDPSFIEELPHRILDLTFVKSARAAMEEEPARRHSLALQAMRTLAEVPMLRMSDESLMAAAAASRPNEADSKKTSVLVGYEGFNIDEAAHD